MMDSSCRILFQMLAVCSAAAIITPVLTLERRKFARATIPEPKPCKSGVVCDDDDDYPKMVVEKMIKNNKNLLAASPNLQHAEEVDNSTGSIQEFCETRRKYIPIRKARNLDGVWRYVLNDGNQYYYVELCRNADTPCKFSNYLPSGYTSVCRQKYVHFRLQAVVGDKTVQDEFPIPSCCYCSVTSHPLSKEITRRIMSNKVT